MKIINEDKFRSEGRGVNKSEDMVRLIIYMTAKERQEFNKWKPFEKVNNPPDWKQEYVLCASIHIQDEMIHLHQPKNIETGYVVTGHRHCNCFQVLSITKTDWKKYQITQGFLTSKNRFIGRSEAYDLSLKTKQAQEETSDSAILTSEDIY